MVRISVILKATESVASISEAKRLIKAGAVSMFGRDGEETIYMNDIDMGDLATLIGVTMKIGKKKWFTLVT